MLECLMMKSPLNKGSVDGIKAIRLVLLGSSDPTWVGVAELQIFNRENVNVAYSSNAVAEASSFYPTSQNVYDPYKINNNDFPEYGYWCSETGKNANENRTCWIGLRFSQKVDISELVLYGTANYHPTKFDIEVSKDGSTFEKVGETIFTGWTKHGKTYPPLKVNFD